MLKVQKAAGRTRHSAVSNRSGAKKEGVLRSFSVFKGKQRKSMRDRRQTRRTDYSRARGVGKKEGVKKNGLSSFGFKEVGSRVCITLLSANCGRKKGSVKCTDQKSKGKEQKETSVSKRRVPGGSKCCRPRLAAARLRGET